MRRVGVLNLVVLLGCVACTAPLRELIVVLPDEGAPPGQVTIARPGQPAQMLTGAYASAQVRDGRVQVKPVTSKAVDEVFGGVLAVPGPKAKAYTLYFETASTTLTTESQILLAELLAEAVSREAAEVLIEGHTSETGTAEENDRLSLQRATLIRDLLVKQSTLERAWVRSVGRGSRHPLIHAPGKEIEKNRRVEVIIR